MTSKSSTTTEAIPRAKRRYPPIHPGEVLRVEYLRPLGISRHRLAVDINVPDNRIGDIVRGKRPVTAETAIRLGLYFGTTPRFWINLQAHYDLEVAADTLGRRLEKEVKRRAA